MTELELIRAIDAGQITAGLTYRQRVAIKAHLSGNLSSDARKRGMAPKGMSKAFREASRKLRDYLGR